MELGFAGISSREILQPTPPSTHMEEAHAEGRQNATLLDSLSIFAKRMKAAGITPRDPIAIAVSGGPDSMALCVLASRWWQHEGSTQDHKLQKLTGLVVDHGLRPDSAAEAQHVQRLVSRLGMDCYVLNCKWGDGRPAPGHLQEAARNARYALMERACRTHGISTLLTAHHADDQVELFMMRMARGSGIAGLAGMAFCSHMYPRRPTPQSQQALLLVRPLLDLAKYDLYAVCKDTEQEWIEDPTNQNQTFARNRIRKALADPLYQTSRIQLRNLIAACRQTRAVLDRERDNVLNYIVTVSQDFAHATIDVERLTSIGVSDEVLVRALGAILQFVAQKEKPPRGKALKSFVERIRLRPFQGAFTLGGCHVAPAPGSKGSRVMVCLSPDSPTPAMPLGMSSWKPDSLETLVNPWLEERPTLATQESRFEEGCATILQTKEGSPCVLEQGKDLGLISVAVASLLESLKLETAQSMTTARTEGRVAEAEEQNIVARPDVRRQLLPFGETCHFMNRFLVSWLPRLSDANSESKIMTLRGDRRGRCCLLREKPDACVRHFEEDDWDQLLQVLRTNLSLHHPDKVSSWCVYQYENDWYGGNKDRRLQEQQRQGTAAPKKDTSQKPKDKRLQANSVDSARAINCAGYVTSKAQRALAILRCIPKPVRRGLPVLVSAHGLLLAIPVSRLCLTKTESDMEVETSRDQEFGLRELTDVYSVCRLLGSTAAPGCLRLPRFNQEFRLVAVVHLGNENCMGRGPSRTIKYVSLLHGSYLL